jgi:hypothetical protein
MPPTFLSLIARICNMAAADQIYSRVALKKYVKVNNSINASDKMFDVLFNKALKAGVEKGEFSQPKGKSGANVEALIL